MDIQDLRDYQEDAIDFIYDRDSTLLLAKMGAGKTVIAATAAYELIKNEELKRILIVAPLRVAQLVWPQEVDKWDHLPVEAFRYAIGTLCKREQALKSQAPIIVINYDTLAWLTATPYWTSFDGIIWDEVTRMKHPTSKRFRAARKSTPDVKWKVGMTGTFPGDKLMDAFGQLYMVDDGKRLGRTLNSFRTTYFDEIPRATYSDYEPKPGAAETVERKINDITFRLRSEDYEAQLSSLVTNRLDVVLSDYARERYEKFKHELVLKLADGEITAADARVAVGKLQQIADGFVYKGALPEFPDMQPKDVSNFIWLHDAKIDAFEEIVESADSPLLVVYRYLAEVKVMQKLHPGPILGSGLPAESAEAAIDAWNAGELSRLYIHPASAGHGLNLQAGGHTVVWYGLTWSRAEYDQTVARLHRGGQEHPVFVHQIVARETVDEMILSTLDMKKEIADVFMESILGEK